jgi:hypothetical protein
LAWVWIDRTQGKSGAIVECSARACSRVTYPHRAKRSKRSRNSLAFWIVSSIKYITGPTAFSFHCHIGIIATPKRLKANSVMVKAQLSGIGQIVIVIGCKIDP